MRRPLLLALLLLAGCDDSPGQWSAIVYPDQSDHSKFETTARFKTFEYCRKSAIERMKALQITKNGDYECGYRCRPPAETVGRNVCEKTRK